MGQIKFLTSLVMITVFVIAVVSYGIGFATDNAVAVSLSNNSDFSGLGSDLTDISATGFSEFNASDVGFAESEISAGSESFRTGGVLKEFGKNSTVTGVYRVLSAVQNTIFGGREGGFGVVFNSLIFVLGIISALYIYKTWRGGNPD